MCGREREKEGQRDIWTEGGGKKGEGEGEERGGEERPKKREPQDVNSEFIVLINLSIKELRGKVTKKEREK